MTRDSFRIKNVRNHNQKRSLPQSKTFFTTIENVLYHNRKWFLTEWILRFEPMADDKLFPPPGFFPDSIHILSRHTGGNILFVISIF
jgi:hypothetical protein